MPANATWRPKHNPWLIAVSVMLATFMEVIDTSIAAVALPYIAGSVSATNDEATWVLTSYLVANAVMLPASAWFSLRFGRKRFLMICIVIFVVSSFFCGSSTSLAMILIARAVQGAGGGALQPLSQAILIESFPPAKQGLALAMYALGVVVAPVIGPTLGGYLTDNLSWRWAFYINIPIGILALVLQSKFLEDPPYVANAKPGRLDVFGLGLLAVWLGALQVICDKGQEDDWFGSNLIRFMTVTLIAGFIAWLVREVTAQKPLVKLSIFANRNFSIGCLLIFLFGAGVYGVTTVLPLFYQDLLGYDAFSAGLAVAPRGLGAMLSSMIVGAVVAKLDSRYLVATGFAIFAGTCLWTSGFNLQMSQSSLFWPIAISGCALALVFVPLSGLSFGTLPQSEVGNASGLYNLLRNVGGSIGIALVNTLAQRHAQTHRNELVHSLSGASIPLRNQLSALTQLMSKHAGPALATKRAYAEIARTLASQAQLWAYIDDFRYLAIVFACCIPVAFLLKKAKASTAAGH